MTIPPYIPPGGQSTVGLTPTSSSDVNVAVGSLLRQFTEIRSRVDHFQSWLVTIDLKAQPYLMSDEDETLIKSAIGGLDASLKTVDMTFINRLTGLW
jgi:hypothetical protein